MLNKKVSHKKLRPKTPKEPKYSKWLHEVHQPSCFVCNVSIGIEMHHVKEYSNDYRDDTKIIPLCYNHHHGQEISPHGTSKLFREVYPIEVQLEKAKELYNAYKEQT